MLDFSKFDSEKIINEFNYRERLDKCLRPVYNPPNIQLSRIPNIIEEQAKVKMRTDINSQILNNEYEIDDKEKKLKKLESRLNSIDKNIDAKKYTLEYIKIIVISIIIPFIFLIVINALDNNISKIGMLVYIIITFIYSMIQMVKMIK